LSNEDVGLFWEICAYEKAIWNETGKFCTLFQEHDHELLSYWSDLSFYWRRGYGNKLTKLLSVEIGQEIKHVFQSTASELRAVLRFGHAETVMPLFVFFNLFKDPKPLLHSTPESEWSKRQWNTSKICPFQANIAFFLADCAGVESVVIQVNEQTVSTVELSHFLTNLNLAMEDKTCETDKSIHGTIFGC
jgi:hypothetical protein